MKINKSDVYHGACLRIIVHDYRGTVNSMIEPSLYNVSINNEKYILLLKYANCKLSKWSFSFNKQDKQKLDAYNSHGMNILIGLLCIEPKLYNSQFVILPYSEHIKNHSMITIKSIDADKLVLFTSKGQNVPFVKF